VDHDRFDDVEFTIVETPEPAPRRRRRGLAAMATLVVAGGLAAGASALASSDEPAARDNASRAAPRVSDTSGGLRLRRGYECRQGGGRHHHRGNARDTALRY
jgi:hypothetical protein